MPAAATGPHGLIPLADQGHFDVAGCGDPAGLVAELIEVEITAEVAVQPLQQVQGEAGGDTGCVVVGRLEPLRCLGLVDPDQQCSIRTKQTPKLAQQCLGGCGGEVPQGAAGEETQAPLLQHGVAGELLQLAVVAADAHHRHAWMVLLEPRAGLGEMVRTDVEGDVGRPL